MATQKAPGRARGIALTIVGASSLAIAALALAAQNSPPVVPISHIDGPVVMAAPVKRLTDSVRLAEGSFTQLCSRQSTALYVKRACVILTAARRNLDTLYASRFTVRKDSVFSQDTVFHTDTVFVPDPAPPAVVHDTVTLYLFGPPRPAGACMPPECPYGVVQITTNSDSMWFPRSGVDTVTLCAVVQRPLPGGNVGVRELAWPPVRIRTSPSGDSLLSWGNRGGNPLAAMCQKAVDHFGIPAGDSTTAPRVTWSGLWFPYRGRQLWRPIASLP